MRLLGQDRFHRMLFFHAGQANVESLVLNREKLVVDSQAVQDRRIQIVDVDRVRGDVVTELIRFAVDDASFHAAAGQPDAKAARMMIPAVVGVRERSLRVHRAAEFAAPDDERVFEESPLLEILNERCRGLIGVSALLRDFFGEVRVLVPAHVIELNEADVLFGHAPGQQTVSGIAAGLVNVRAIHVQDVLWFVRDVGHLGNRRLHAEGEFRLLDPREHLGIGSPLEADAIERGDVVQHPAA